MITIETKVNYYQEVNNKLEPLKQHNHIIEVVGLNSGECYVNFDGLVIKREDLLKVFKTLDSLENMIHEFL